MLELLFALEELFGWRCGLDRLAVGQGIEGEIHRLGVGRPGGIRSGHRSIAT